VRESEESKRDRERGIRAAHLENPGGKMEEKVGRVLLTRNSCSGGTRLGGGGNKGRGKRHEHCSKLSKGTS